MAFRDVWRSIAKWVRGKPSGPKLDLHGETMAGHRGVAMGSATTPDLSRENIAKWRVIDAPELEDYLTGHPLFVHSSNVAMFQWFAEVEQLMVEYKPKKKQPARVYLYKNISAFEALLFAKALSKGTWVWDHLRIRGTVRGFKKPYVRIR